MYFVAIMYFKVGWGKGFNLGLLVPRGLNDTFPML